MVISSLVVTALADEVEAVSKELEKIEGVEVHETNGSKLVVTIESETVDSSSAIANGFVNIYGVLNVGLVYVNFEDDPSLYPDTAEK